MELDPQPRRDHEQGGGAGLRKLDFFRFGSFLNSGATDIVFVTLPRTAVETAIARCSSRWAVARGHRLNTSIVLAAVHGLSGLFSGGIGRVYVRVVHDLELLRYVLRCAIERQL